MKLFKDKLLMLGMLIILGGLFCNSAVIAALLGGKIQVQSLKVKILTLQIFLIFIGLMGVVLREKLSDCFTRQTHKHRQICFTFATFLLVLTFCFFIPEILIRTFKPRMTYSQLVSLARTGEYKSCDFIPFTLKANNRIQSKSIEYPGETVDVSTDQWKIRLISADCP